MKNQILLIFILLLVFACQSKNKKGVEDEKLQLAIVDSIQVDYLGNLFIYGYNSEDGLYLGRWNSNEEYVLFDDSGNFQQRFVLPSEGPNAIKWAIGVGFLDGKFTVMDQHNGLIQFSNKGEIVNKISIPANYFYLNGLSFSAQKIGENYVYSRPERESIGFDGIQWDDLTGLLVNNYKSPLIEVYDPKSGTIRNTMKFPENTVYSSGQFYNAIPPSIIKFGKEWIVFLLAEMKYFVYQEIEGEVEFVKEVNLNIKDAIPMPGVPMKQYLEWDEQKGNIIFGKIEKLYRRENDVIVIYTKGVDEEISKNYNRENRIEWMDFIYNIPRYAAVFNNDHQLVQKDILLPKGLIWSSVVNNKGEILALKNQDYFEVEEDFVTFYKLDLASSN
jgi:hypothetical protein